MFLTSVTRLFVVAVAPDPLICPGSGPCSRALLSRRRRWPSVCATFCSGLVDNTALQTPSLLSAGAGPWPGVGQPAGAGGTRHPPTPSGVALDGVSRRAG